MKQRLIAVILCGTVPFLFSKNLLAESGLFTLGDRGNYVKFDPDTGDVDTVLLEQPGRPGGIAESLEGNFYTITYGNAAGPRGLYELNPLTGLHEYVSNTSNVYPIFGMAFAPSGTLYVNEYLGRDKSYMGILDIETGQFTRTGQISGDAGELFSLDFRPNTENLYGTRGDGLYSVDLDTSATQLVVNSDTINFEHVLGFTFLTEDLVYFSGFYSTSSYPNYDYGIALYDLATGSLVNEVALPYFVHGTTPLGHIAVIPEPATLALITLGGLGVLRRRN